MPRTWPPRRSRGPPPPAPRAPESHGSRSSCRHRGTWRAARARRLCASQSRHGRPVAGHPRPARARRRPARSAAPAPRRGRRSSRPSRRGPRGPECARARPPRPAAARGWPAGTPAGAVPRTGRHETAPRERAVSAPGPSAARAVPRGRAVPRSAGARASRCDTGACRGGSGAGLRPGRCSSPSRGGPRGDAPAQRCPSRRGEGLSAHARPRVVPPGPGGTGSPRASAVTSGVSVRRATRSIMFASSRMFPGQP